MPPISVFQHFKSLNTLRLRVFGNFHFSVPLPQFSSWFLELVPPVVCQGYCWFRVIHSQTFPQDIDHCLSSECPGLSSVVPLASELPSKRKGIRPVFC